MSGVRDAAKRVLPRPMVDWIRRRLARRRYLRAISYELLAKDTRMDDLEAQIAARRDGFYERLARDVLERTDLVLQELDRRIEGVSARHGERLADVERELRALREAVERLRPPSLAPAPRPSPAASSAAERPEPAPAERAAPGAS